MKKQALTLAIAAALSAPSALAAQDTSGMHYTSASEGFYASLRARVDFGNGDNGANVNENSSRIGIQGTNDLGGGMEGFYRWEGGVKIDAGGYSDVWRIRLGYVGLRGAFGDVRVGSFWSNDYNWTYGSTDVANNYSGYLVYDFDRLGRVSKSIQYTTPDLNGFQGAVMVGINNTNNLKKASCDNPRATIITTGGGTTPRCSDEVPSPAADADRTYNAATGSKDSNDIDTWNLAAKYEIQGFTVAGSYHNSADALAATDAVVTGLGDNNQIGGAGSAEDTMTAAKKADDRTSWTLRLGYSQDNWYVNGWYGVTNAQSTTAPVNNNTGNDLPGVFNDEDEVRVSMAGGVEIDKINLYGLWEKVENLNGVDGDEDAYATLGAQYRLGGQSHVWLEYWNRDLDSNKDAKDVVSVGLQHNF